MGKNSRKRREQAVVGRGGGGGRATGREQAVVFDPAARQEYLQGFSKRKHERRAFGLAMQKVKDRKAKLEQRAESKQAIKEQIEQAEKQKEELLEEYMLDYNGGSSDGVKSAIIKGSREQTPPTSVKLDSEPLVDKVDMYQDDQTQTQWGGEVIVTTSTKIPGGEDDGDDNENVDDVVKPSAKRRKIDAEQEYAGKVEKYLTKLKGKLPAKKRKDNIKKQKGLHGAVAMKGVAGSGSEFKMAQKVLVRSQAKQKGSSIQKNSRRKKR